MKESDWKTFRALVPMMRERYVARKNKLIRSVLAAPKKTESERFWEAYRLMDEEARILERCLDGHSRSKMFLFMWTMQSFGMLTDEDLKAFSPELQEQLKGLGE